MRTGLVFLFFVLHHVSVGAEWVYIGCYVEQKPRELFDAADHSGASSTLAKCEAFCTTSAGGPYAFGGLQYGVECYCGNSIGKYGMAPESECDMDCKLDPTRKCGGSWRSSVYMRPTQPPQTAAPDTPAPLTVAPPTTAPDTAAPPTQPPNTVAPDTPVPPTPAPQTPAPDTPAPVTPAPVTPAPPTSAPVTAAPPTVVPPTSVPLTPAPVTSAPLTPSPTTPAPLTQAPATSAPMTSAPLTSAPLTPAPLTTAPLTTAPSTTAPQTSAPLTSAPLTPAPLTPAPLTIAPLTPAPLTPAPRVPLTPSAAPDTGSPPTALPTTAEPATVPPALAPSLAPLLSLSPTAAPSTLTPPGIVINAANTEEVARVFENVTTSLNASVVTALVLSMAAPGFGAGNALRLALVSSGCTRDLPWVFHPSGLEAAGSKSLGLVLLNTAGLCAVSVLCIVVLVIATFVRERKADNGKISKFDLQGMSHTTTNTATSFHPLLTGFLRIPAIPMFLLMFTFQGTTLGAMNVVFHEPTWQPVGALALTYCIVAPLVCVLITSRGAQQYATYALATNRTNTLTRVFLGPGEWINLKQKMWVQRFSGCVLPYRTPCVWFLGVEYLTSFALSAVTSLAPTTAIGCGHMKVACTVILCISWGVMLGVRPHARRCDLIALSLVHLFEIIGVVLMAVGYYLEDPGHAMFLGARVMIGCAMSVLISKLVADGAVEIFIFITGRRDAVEASVKAAEAEELQDLLERVAAYSEMTDARAVTHSDISDVSPLAARESLLRRNSRLSAMGSILGSSLPDTDREGPLLTAGSYSHLPESASSRRRATSSRGSALAFAVL